MKLHSIGIAVGLFLMFLALLWVSLPMASYGLLPYQLGMNLAQLQAATSDLNQTLFSNHFSTVNCDPVGRLTQAQAKGNSSNSGLSSRESFGFFNYDDEKWERKKLIHKIQSRRQHMSEDKVGHVFYQNNWEPSWSCGYEERIGRPGDGGKWVCDAYRVRKAPKCIVVSIGSNNDWSFEDAMHDLNPRCEIHTFDHTLKSPLGKPDFVKYYPLGLGSTDKAKTKRLATLLKEAGLEGKPIDVFKIDCEGCEYEVFREFSTVFLQQVLIEIHFQFGNADRNHKLFEEMSRHGYVIFHKESNTIGCRGDCIEYALIRLHLPDS
mmetsp:Transcript_15393/g.23972  ORF Transcript_15393/g.23972 Transcript_15393/m.23972 type:complete len:321 (+) Transcript_15393:218-1180(+)|eukprot:CAMPEP_0184301580 /NCGR_PEP_ID=MMETSP1049-20130417/11751_1 /TAXON_ID=77928 /ORGANISM="Proteomonas sulcata, Strain CCMP704" /LENGTH=320 /DNA_ID=CAMNT_0026612621 /DNA_START=206 /DNA_END=1168 /DNA_ORIENTATION=+